MDAELTVPDNFKMAVNNQHQYQVIHIIIPILFNNPYFKTLKFSLYIFCFRIGTW